MNPIRIVVLLLALNIPAVAGERADARQAPSATRHVVPVPGVDLGDEINAAYASLPPTGGVIVVNESASFVAPIVFATPDKPALLVGAPPISSPSPIPAPEEPP